ncbi:hypothetical protein [Sphingomonas aliaeris]|uniref:hypothetical protein n=1 Tax=Sphingomonas aliaeris TaxID=2759526 RepID=UPI001CED7EE3|nr:hypothetical protein [Sphingomonas aliaeris]
MTWRRQERRYDKGVRVRVDAPGWPIHGLTGAIDMDMATAASPCIIRLDNGKQTATGSAEVARLRDQSGGLRNDIERNAGAADRPRTASIGRFRCR